MIIMIQIYNDLSQSTYICFDLQIAKGDIDVLGLYIREHFKKSKNRIKIIFDKNNLGVVVNNIDLVTNDQKLNVCEYITNNFVLNKADIPQFKQNWSSDYSKDFEIIEYSQKNNDSTIHKNLICNSFGIKTRIIEGEIKFEADLARQESITSNFESAINVRNFYTFLVKSSEGLVVGLFSMFVFGDQAHLCNVAGRSTLVNSFKGKKVDILSAGIVFEFLNNKLFEGCKSLIFSSSKDAVANMYSDFGFQKSTNRSGLIIDLDR
jgi:hypothetical protein